MAGFRVHYVMYQIANVCPHQILSQNIANLFQMVDTWLTEFQIDQIHVVLQKGYILYV